MIWMVIGAGLLLLPVVLYVSGRRASRAAVKNWNMFLTPANKGAFVRVEAETRAELELADVAFEGAAQAAAAGADTKSMQMLDMGCELIERYCPTMLQSLKAMAVLSRMVAAITPMPTLRPKDFRLSQLAQLAYLHAFLHQFLVGTGERFRLRLMILGRGFRLIGRLVARSASRIRDREEGAVEEWGRLALARADLHALTNESLNSLRVLVETLETAPRAAHRS
jgi:hypothetical protein